MSTKNKTVKKAEKDEQVKYGPVNTEIVKKLISIEDSTQLMKLKIRGNGVTNITEVTRNELYNPSAKLFNLGAEILVLKDFKNEMIWQEWKAPTEYFHKSIGWGEYENEPVFKAYEAVGCDSTYKGKFDIKPAGSFEGWKETIEKYVLPQPALSLITILGLSAVTMGFFQNEMDGSLFCHIAGASSKGKTTSVLSAISTAGNPNLTAKNTLFADFGDTNNYLVSMLAGNHGFPVVFDELSKSETKNLTQFVYNICNGKDKGRLNSNAEQKDTATWCTTVLSTGESSLLARCNNNAGLLVRVLEFCPNEITASAEQAETLKDGIIHNYGWANSILAEYYLDNEEIVRAKFFEYREILKQDIPIRNELVNRLIKKLAAVMTTAYFAKIALEIDFDLNTIEELLIEAVVKQNDEHPFEQSKLFVECLMTDLATNPSRYFQLKQREPLNDLFGQNIRGFVREIRPITVGDEQCSVELIYPTANFEYLLRQFGFSNKLKELKALDEKGFIKKEGKHYSVRRKIAGRKIPVYVLTLPESLLSNRFTNTVTED